MLCSRQTVIFNMSLHVLVLTKALYDSAIWDFESLVSEQDLRRLKEFPYLPSREEVDKFTLFVQQLGVKKISGFLLSSWYFGARWLMLPLDWWVHKTQNAWILPAIIKSCSRITPEHWDRLPSTTNGGEGQHHWTNVQTGIGLPLLEAIERYVTISWLSTFSSLHLLYY